VSAQIRYRGAMGISNEHNLRAPLPETRRFGIQVHLKPGDPFVKLVGPDWQKTHWFASAGERDGVLADMERRHLYSRLGDEPSMLFERIERPAA
jgi:hypothetical protein